MLNDNFCYNCKIKLINEDIFFWKSLPYCSMICSKIHWRYPGFIDKKVYYLYKHENCKLKRTTVLDNS